MGTPWCQLPAEYGQWNSVYRRWAAWCDRGVWSRLMASLQTDADLSAGLLDSTVVRAHVRAAGAPKTRRRIPPSAAAEAVSAPRSTSWRIAAAGPCA